MIKKRVAIIYSGQMRTNTLSDNYTSDNIILEATTKYFLNKTFKENYEYDIFFSVDNMNIEKAKLYFGDNLKNVHITESDWLMSPISHSFIDFQEVYNKYMKTDFQNCLNHSNALYQYYRLHCGYLLSKDYEEKNNVKYDYYVRIRPDIRLMQDINPLFNIIKTTNKQIIFEHEQLCIFTNIFEELFDFIKYYGVFNDSISNYELFNHLKKREINFYPEHTMRFCPERQIMEYVNFIINKKNMRFKEVFLGIIYPSFNLLYRGNHVYIGVTYNENQEWNPYDKIENLQ
jgi:hypothetical protein